MPPFPDLGELGAGLNRILYRDGLPNRFASLVYLALTAGDGHVRYLNAGHVPPLVIRGRAIEELQGGSIALGFIPEADFTERAITLTSGDVLVIVDGVIEAMNASDEFFGDDRLRTALLGAAGQPARQLGQAVLSALQPFVGEKKPHDDVSIVVVRRA